MPKNQTRRSQSTRSVLQIKKNDQLSHFSAGCSAFTASFCTSNHLLVRFHFFTFRRASIASFGAGCTSCRCKRAGSCNKLCRQTAKLLAAHCYCCAGRMVFVALRQMRHAIIDNCIALRLAILTGFETRCMHFAQTDRGFRRRLLFLPLHNSGENARGCSYTSRSQYCTSIHMNFPISDFPLERGDMPRDTDVSRPRWVCSKNTGREPVAAIELPTKASWRIGLWSLVNML